MAKILKFTDKKFKAKLESVLNSARLEQSAVSVKVTKIINEVILRKDAALVEFTNKFDKLKLDEDKIRFSDKEIKNLISKVSSEESKTLHYAAERIIKFHERQVPQNAYWTDEAGVSLGWNWLPIKRVGLYVPGGTASYPSSVLMNAIPAGIAGVKEIAMVTPIVGSSVNPLVVLAAKIAGVNEIFKVGGAQAIAALTYGTESIAAVDKIVGPGNSFVAEAKRQVFGKVGIDMVAGPSEVLIIADSKNDPNWIALDLLSQAEHDRNAQSVLITTSESLAVNVKKAVERNLRKLKRMEIARESWETNGAIIVVKNLDKACALSNIFAPEHLQLCVRNPEALIPKISNAGSIFLGIWTPEALGDYIIGTNHVLPTGRSARFSSGLSVLDFMKRLFVSKANRQAISKIGVHGKVLAKSESLEAHELSLDLRVQEVMNTSDGK